VTMEGCGILRDCRYLLLDRDAKFTRSFRAIIASGQVEPLALPARSPNLNAYAERWVVQGYPLWRAFATAGPE
jgi:putative transposase